MTFVAELVQGSDGVKMPPEGYFQEVRKICNENDILFISDEVICDFGRTRKNFGIEHYDVIPDIITMAKGVTSGYTSLGGMVVSEKIHQELINNTEGNFWHGYTYSGHPTTTAVGLKNLEIIKEEKLIEHVQVIGEQMLKGFVWIKEQNSNVTDVRGLGLPGAIEIEKRSAPAEPVAYKIVAKALEKGLICRSAIYERQDALAIAPPFPI